MNTMIINFLQCSDRSLKWPSFEACYPSLIGCALRIRMFFSHKMMILSSSGSDYIPHMTNQTTHKNTRDSLLNQEWHFLLKRWKKWVYRQLSFRQMSSGHLSFWPSYSSPISTSSSSNPYSHPNHTEPCTYSVSFVFIKVTYGGFNC